MQDSMNTTGSMNRATEWFLESLPREKEPAGRRCCSSRWPVNELLAGAKMEAMVWLALAVAGLSGLVVSLWI